MSNSNINISIGNKTIPIKEKYTLISGNLEKEHIDSYNIHNLFETFENFNSLSLNDFLQIFSEIDISYKKLDEYHKMIKFLNSFKKISNNNISILNEYIDSLEQLFSILKIFDLDNKIKFLNKELELSIIKDKSSVLSTKTDFLNKLNTNIAKNKEKLSFLKEDFFKIKNQREQILKTIEEYKEEINELSNTKKAKFGEINKITREMEDPNRKKEDLIIETDLSNSEMIKKLRKEAKDIHNSISQVKLNLNKSNEKLKNIEPRFKIYEKDFSSLNSKIEEQEFQAKNIQIEINKSLSENDEVQFDKSNLIEFSTIRSYDEIQSEIDNINKKMSQIKNFKKEIREKNSRDKILHINEHFSKLIRYFNNNQENLKFLTEEKVLFSSIEKYRDLEFLFNTIEKYINHLLVTINLESELQIIIDNNKEELFLHVIFIRNKKEKIIFDDLTTPEKVFFVVTFFISIKIVLKSKDVIFSNLFIHQRYNKRGSLFRTIEKIIPIFEKNKELRDINFIFIISNLEIKKKIDNVDLIEI